MVPPTPVKTMEAHVKADNSFCKYSVKDLWTSLTHICAACTGCSQHTNKLQQNAPIGAGDAFNTGDLNKMPLRFVSVYKPFQRVFFCWNECRTLTCVISHEFLKRVSMLRLSLWQPRLLFQNCPFASEGATPELDRGCFDLPVCPQPTAVHLRDSEGPWATLSSRCYCLPRWARMPCLSLPPSITLPNLPSPLSLSLSIYLSFSLAPLCLLSHRDLWSNWSSRLHKETQIVFHLQPVTSCALCTFVLPLSTKNAWILPMAIFIIIGFESKLS